MIVKKFDAARDTEIWNSFVSQGKNSTFLFNRNFVEYHADRFADYSLLLYDENKLVAVLPANITSENILKSHQGLTYGGLVVAKEIKLTTVLSCFYHLLKFLSEQQIHTLDLKCFPSFYNASPTDEVEYALFLTEAQLYRRDVAMMIDMQHRIPYTGNIRREGAKAEKLQAQIKNDDGFDGFWNEVLAPNLARRFGVKPVHTLEEIILLKACFPENIQQHNVYLNGKLAAGTTLFITETTAHCQYISATEEGRKTGCLNYLFKQLIDTTFAAKRFFDFGIVNENGGKDINTGMLFWKESFGGRAQRHDFYKIDTAKYNRLHTYI